MLLNSEELIKPSYMILIPRYFKGNFEWMNKQYTYSKNLELSSHNSLI